MRYSGQCRGGPLSGMPLHHFDATTYYMFKKDKRIIIGYQMPKGGPSELPPDIEVGAYEYDGERWQWTREIEWIKS